MSHKTRTTKEIYGCNKFWGDMPYNEALKVKIKLLDFELFEENRKHYSVRIPNRINIIVNDIKHNENLLKE